MITDINIIDNFPTTNFDKTCILWCINCTRFVLCIVLHVAIYFVKYIAILMFLCIVQYQEFLGKPTSGKIYIYTYLYTFNISQY